jgi:adenylate cyclase
LRNLQSWRLASGLILFAFVLTHFLNHALGHLSLDAMNRMQVLRHSIWNSWPGSILLYGAVAVHLGLVLWKLIHRRTWRMPPWEAAQIGLGLAIPFLAIAHVITTRGLSALYGVDPTYSIELRVLWPARAMSQSLLLVIVWLHATIGLHHWLKHKRWYRQWRPLLGAMAIVVPTLALTGWIEGARRVALMDFPGPPLSKSLLDARDRLLDGAEIGIWAAVVVVLGAILVLRAMAWFRSGPTIVYEGGRQVRAEAGATLLEMSRAAGVPHASVCGGRGRCTTCRVLIIDGGDRLPAPNPTESAALQRIAAPPGVRLACQIRPSESLTVRLLIPVREAMPGAAEDAYRWGVERTITILFADLRGFTGLAEKLYPYDSVFLLNRYFEVTGRVVEQNGGEVNQLLGDGIMAVFGVASSRESGSRDALLAAQGMLAALDALNEEFAAILPAPLRMGVGIHTGPAVLGRIGGGPDRALAVLGDSVNIASRLESLNKDYASILIASDAVAQASGLVLASSDLREIVVRGRSEPLLIHVVRTRPELADAATRPAAA